jgi:GNAT superfamily N-acetyltransferase
MKTELPPTNCGLRVVSPPDWSPSLLLRDQILLGHHLPTGADLPTKTDWARWFHNFQIEILFPQEGFETFILTGPGEDVRGWVMAETNRLDANQNLMVPFLSDLVVLRPWRGRGYGRFLVRRVENFFAQRGKQELNVICPFDLTPWFSDQGYELLPDVRQGEAHMCKKWGVAAIPRKDAAPPQ